MIEVEVRVNTSKFDRMISDVPAAMARARRVALNEIGNTVKNHAFDAFTDASLRPSKWEPRKDKKAKHPLLIRSGDLRQNIRYVVTGPDTVMVGTKVKYAPYHQFGTKRMPARPFFPFARNGKLLPGVLHVITQKVQKAFSDELGKLGRH